MKRETDYGYSIKSYYTPEDVPEWSYEASLGNPGSFPYTRGYHEQGYRSRMWTQRMTAGLGTSKEANKVLHKYREMGQRGGMCVISDRVFSSCIDADHPLGRREAGVLGWPGCSLLEFEELMDGVPLTGQSITLLGSSAPSALRLAYVVALAEKRGIDPREVHGSVIESPFENYFGQTDVQPFDLNLKLFLAASEYVIRNGIRMRACIISQHFQESGGNNAQAIAIELSMLKELCGLLVNERGLDFDDVALLPYELVSVGSRFFEEIAKVRATRRMWARMAREHFRAKKDKSCQLLIAVHTSGRTMTYQQPLNNIARCAIQTLAGKSGRIVGYSDHTLGIDAAVLSVALGARIIEKHFTLSKTHSDFRDHALSADPAELAELVRRVRLAQTLLGSGDKILQEAEKPTAAAARRSIVAREAFPAGHLLSSGDFDWLRPGGGLAPGQESLLLGRRLSRAVTRGEMITQDMVA